LKVDRSTIYKYLPNLKAKGIATTHLTKKAVRFREATLDRAIRRSEERDEPLFELPQKHKQQSGLNRSFSFFLCRGGV
jgi:hypothetical protein